MKWFERDDVEQGATRSLRAGIGFLRSMPVLCAVMFMLDAVPARAQAVTDDALNKVTFDQNLNTQISLDLPFWDEQGRAVQLRDYFGKKPVVLVLGYYNCPMLCTLVLNGLVATMGDMRWSAGREFEIVNVSINPHETSALALAKKRSYVKRYGRNGSEAGWHFLTGDEPAIRQLADEVGFRYVYDPASKEYAHPSGLIILTPQGKVSHYLFGVTFDAQDLYTSLQAASTEKVGSPIRRLVLLCFHYNPITGKYGATIMLVVRLMGVATVLGLIWLIVFLTRRSKSRVGVEPSSGARMNPGDALRAPPAAEGHDP